MKKKKTIKEQLAMIDRIKLTKGEERALNQCVEDWENRYDESTGILVMNDYAGKDFDSLLEKAMDAHDVVQEDYDDLLVWFNKLYQEQKRQDAK